jgi:hypothetical protein
MLSSCRKLDGADVGVRTSLPRTRRSVHFCACCLAPFRRHGAPQRCPVAVNACARAVGRCKVQPATRNDGTMGSRWAGATNEPNAVSQSDECAHRAEAWCASADAFAADSDVHSATQCARRQREVPSVVGRWSQRWWSAGMPVPSIDSVLAIAALAGAGRCIPRRLPPRSGLLIYPSP